MKSLTREDRFQSPGNIPETVVLRQQTRIDVAGGINRQLSLAAVAAHFFHRVAYAKRNISPSDSTQSINFDCLDPKACEHRFGGVDVSRVLFHLNDSYPQRYSKFDRLTNALDCCFKTAGALGDRIVDLGVGGIDRKSQSGIEFTKAFQHSAIHDRAVCVNLDDLIAQAVCVSDQFQ